MRTITMASEVKERPGNYQDRSGCARDFGSQGVTPRLNTDRARLEMLIAGRAPTLGRRAFPRTGRRPRADQLARWSRYPASEDP